MISNKMFLITLLQLNAMCHWSDVGEYVCHLLEVIQFNFRQFCTDLKDLIADIDLKQTKKRGVNTSFSMLIDGFEDASQIYEVQLHFTK